jgi:hypothetical protein
MASCGTTETCLFGLVLFTHSRLAVVVMCSKYTGAGFSIKVNLFMTRR